MDLAIGAGLLGRRLLLRQQRGHTYTNSNPNGDTYTYANTHSDTLPEQRLPDVAKDR